ncbi:hypothetical protein TVAG_038800 [Trichomonas vaginalis G3]|uniref:UDP-N-acetylglucosamine transferase subunit ALG14 n=2 Tax=Trichomonas vaginalis (strain ATCC PRA-98 / G3) TaxID=412133 RepID=A2E5J3_TRIV3|nr:hypothetical protein TVAG_038800 [Trichomonas vaginalis G3]|eukprot:XP_001324257.1 hypothetical protein [Trichomonas vaginalis G3]
MLVLAYRVYKCLPALNKKKITKNADLHVMSVLGSGGHTGEMMPLIEALSKEKKYTKFTIICADSDKLSFQHPSIPKNSILKTIPRSRKVGQSFFTSIFTTIWSILASLTLMFQKPDLLLVNGPGVCLPVVLSVFIGNVLGISNCSIVFVESFCRVHTLSLTGKLIYNFCDLFFGHWKELLPLKKRAQLIDLFGLNHTKAE